MQYKNNIIGKNAGVLRKNVKFYEYKFFKLLLWFDDFLKFFRGGEKNFFSQKVFIKIQINTSYKVFRLRRDGKETKMTQIEQNYSTANATGYFNTNGNVAKGAIFDDVENENGTAFSILGNAESTYGDAYSVFGNAYSALGNAQSLLGDEFSTLGIDAHGNLNIDLNLTEDERNQFLGCTKGSYDFDMP